MSVKTFKEGIKLDPQSADPTATEGQVQFADGSVRNKGLWQYKDGAWSAIGGGAGDADTIHLIKANDSQASDFSLKSIDDVLPDFEGSDTLAGTFSIPTTGSEALLSNDDDHKVFKFASAASSQYDAWGISKSIPRYIRGEDVVLQFKYRTADTSGDSADGDYMIWVWDETNGVNTTTTSTGSVAAGTAITVGTTTGMSVGDKIWVGETGGTAQVTEAHVTEVTSGTQVKISETVNLTSGDRFVTGILTDVLTTLDAADDDTNKTGNDFKVVFNVPDTCASVALLFQQLTSQTDSFLYVDNILISSEVVKRVSARGESKKYKISEAQNAMSNLTNEVQFNSPVETYDEGFLDLFTIDHSSDPSKWTAKKKVKVSVQVNGELASARQMHLAVNGTPLMNGTTTDTSNYNNFVSADTILNKGDYITFGSGSDGSFDGTSLGSTATSCIATFTATPEVNDVVVVESTDSVIGEWTSYTPTTQGFGTISSVDFKWRRVGQSMEVMGIFTSGTTTASEAQVGLPNGYQIDSSLIGTLHQVGDGGRNNSNATTRSWNILGTGGDSFVNIQVDHYSIAVNPFTPELGSNLMSSGEIGYFNFTVPIAGWDANPKPLLAFPTITYGQDAEHFLANTHAGYGSSAAFIPYFTNEVDNTISNLGTLTNDSTDGCKFTASKRCKVTVSYTGAADGSARTIGISKNSSQLGTAINSITTADRLAAVYCVASSTGSSCSFTGILEPGDVIRPHNSAAFAPLTTNVIAFSILVEPEEGQVNQAAIISQPEVILSDFKSSTTSGGTATSGSWQTRDLNTLKGDIASVGITLSSNQFTLPAGKYSFEWNCPAYNVNRHQSRVRNTTDSISVGFGTNAYSPGTAEATDTIGKGIVTITKSTTFELQHQVQTTKATDGFGISHGGSFTVENEVYAQIRIRRLK